MNIIKTISASGKIELNMPDDSKAVKTYEPTPTGFKSTFVWDNGLNITMIVDKNNVSIICNHDLIQTGENKFKVI